MSACRIEGDTMTDRHAQGMATRRKVLGDAHVDRAQARQTELDAPFQRLITEAAWGHVWSSDALTHRERSMITLALLAGLGNLEEFELHLRATANTGASAQDVAQVLQHVAIYAGVPRANAAMKLAKAILAELEEKP
jgi:4-carboxymuconolactone decarboxylase